MSKRSVAAFFAVAAMTLTWPGASSAGTVSTRGAPAVPVEAAGAANAGTAVAVFARPEHVAFPRQQGSIPALVIDRNAVVTAVWRQTYTEADGTEEYAIRAARRGIGGRWTRPRTIGCPRPSDACADNHPEIGVDARGTVTVAWSNGTGVMAVRRPAGGAWAKPRRLATPTGGWVDEVAVAASGAVWVTGSTTDYGVWVAYLPAAGPWTAPVQFAVGASAYYTDLYPDTAVAAWPDGRALLAYDQPRGRDSYETVVRTFFPRSGWSAAKVLGPGFPDRLVVGPRHSAVCILGQIGGGAMLASDLRSGRWRGPVRLAGGSFYEDVYGAAVAIDRAGNEIVGWTDFREEFPMGGHVASKPVGGAWSRTTFDGASPPYFYDDPRVVVQTNNANDAVAMFRRRTLFRPHGQTWTPPLKLGATSGVILPSGAVLRMWWQDNTLHAQRVHLG